MGLRTVTGRDAQRGPPGGAQNSSTAAAALERPGQVGGGDGGDSGDNGNSADSGDSCPLINLPQLVLRPPDPTGPSVSSEGREGWLPPSLLPAPSLGHIGTPALVTVSSRSCIPVPAARPQGASAQDPCGDIPVTKGIGQGDIPGHHLPSWCLPPWHLPAPILPSPYPICLDHEFGFSHQIIPLC